MDHGVGVALLRQRGGGGGGAMGAREVVVSLSGDHERAMAVAMGRREGLGRRKGTRGEG